MDLGSIEINGLNSGTWTGNVADAALLFSKPSGLLAVLDTDVNTTGSIVVTVIGTDAANAALTGVGTFTPPAYSGETGYIFPKAWGVEIIATAPGVFKTITSITIAAPATAKNARVSIFGLPALSTYRLVGCKVQLNYAPRVPMPHSIPCGRDETAFAVLGMIPEGKMTITAKIINESEGLSRYNGIRVTGLIKRKADDKVTTAHNFFLGLTITSKKNVGEAIDPATLEGEGLYEDMASVLAE